MCIYKKTARVVVFVRFLTQKKKKKNISLPNTVRKINFSDVYLR